MAAPIRTVTSDDVSRQMDSAPPLSDLNASMAETVLSYIEGDDLETAKTYVAAMDEVGLARMLRNLVTASQIIAVALVRKSILRSDAGDASGEGK